MKNRRIRLKWIIILVLLLFIVTGGSLLLMLYLTFGDQFTRPENISSLYSNLKLDSSDDEENTVKTFDSTFLKSIMPDSDTAIKIIRLSSDPGYKPEIEFDDKAGKYVRKVYNGKRINIAITGVDSRLGQRFKHADANHVISILADSGKIEIISIPRDTYADAGFDDTTGFNKLTTMRAKGRNAYLNEVASIAGLDKIHYFGEFGFSQAMGIIEWFGHDKPKSTLKILRSRQALGGDDYQRVYNQAQFMRQMILNNFSKLNGIAGEVIIRGALSMIESNMNTAKFKEVLKILKSSGFSGNPEDISIKIRPSFPIEFKVYDFTDPLTLLHLTSKIDAAHSKSKKDTSHSNQDKDPEYIYKVLKQRIHKIVGDTIKNPSQVINNLKIYFEQKAWFQIEDSTDRHEIRTVISDNLQTAYKMMKDSASAMDIKNIIKNEDDLFKLKNNQ